MSLWLVLVLLLAVGIHCAVAAPKPLCMDAELREEIREIMSDGLKAALRRHTSQVFNTWMRDPAQQPARAQAGMRHGIDAYIGSRLEVKNWNPPSCP
jgi:hypothetical protein